MNEVVGFVGAGQMGEPMVARLLDAGYRVLAYARKEPVRERLREQGAELATSVAEVGGASDVVVSCLFSDDQLSAVLGGPAGLMAAARPQTLVISHTTGKASTVTTLAAAFPDGPILLDAPVSGSADDIRAGRLTVLLGGPDDAAARARPILSSYAETIIPTGNLGTALNLKLVNNALFAAKAQLTAAAVELGEAFGIEGEQLLAALAACSGSSFAANSIRRTGGLDTFAKVAAPFLRKDVAACISAAADAGMDLGSLGKVIVDGPLDLA